MPYPIASPAGKTVQYLLDARPTRLAVTVVDLALGCPPNVARLSPDVAAAYSADVVKQKQKAMAALQLMREKPTDLLLPLSSQLLPLTPNGQRFSSWAVNSRTTTLALTRGVVCPCNTSLT